MYVINAYEFPLFFRPLILCLQGLGWMIGWIVVFLGAAIHGLGNMILDFCGWE